MEHDDITVLLIYNGPGVTYNWTFSEAVEQKCKKMKRGLRQLEDNDYDGDVSRGDHGRAKRQA